MEGLFTQAEKPLDEMGQCGVAICGNTNTTHSGLLLRYPDDPVVYLLHLQTDDLKLKQIPGCPHGCVWGIPTVPEARLDDIAKKAILVKDVNKDERVPYGFSTPEGFFDNETGNMLLGPDNIGLTCATFILAIFHMSRINLIDYSSWKPRKEDEPPQQALVDNLVAIGCDKGEVEAVKKQMNGIRYRPEEVIAAAISAPEIKTMEQLEPLGKQVVQTLLNP